MISFLGILSVILFFIIENTFFSNTNSDVKDEIMTAQVYASTAPVTLKPSKIKIIVKIIFIVFSPMILIITSSSILLKALKVFTLIARKASNGTAIAMIFIKSEIESVWKKVCEIWSEKIIAKTESSIDKVSTVFVVVC